MRWAAFLAFCALLAATSGLMGCAGRQNSPIAQASLVLDSTLKLCRRTTEIHEAALSITPNALVIDGKLTILNESECYAIQSNPDLHAVVCYRGGACRDMGGQRSDDSF